LHGTATRYVAWSLIEAVPLYLSQQLRVTLMFQVWSRDRIAAGWKWGAKRDDRKKLHPSLLAYGKLSDDDKQWDRDSAKQTLSVIRALGYVIKRDTTGARRSALNKAVNISKFAISKRHHDDSATVAASATGSTSALPGAPSTPRVPVEPPTMPGSMSQLASNIIRIAFRSVLRA
jgi:hypothetical protein